MKTSILAATAGAALALAGPVVPRDEVIVTDVVTQYYTVTVTVDWEPSTTSSSLALPTYFVNGGKHWTTTSSSSPIPVPTTTSTPEPEPTTSVVVVTYEPEPEPTTTEEAAVPTVVYPASTTTAEAAAAPSDMASNAIYTHNIHRANHSAPDVDWLDEIAGYASNTADTCVFAHDMTQGAGNYGQNIAMWASSDNAAALGESGAVGWALDAWYDGEVDKFLPSYYGQATPDMSNFEAWGHFSQVVWKDTTSIGCSAKLCAAGTMYSDMDAWYIVCNYRPAGNVGGQYASNVLTSLGEASVST